MQTEQGRQWCQQICGGTAVQVIANPVMIPLAQSGRKISPHTVFKKECSVLLAVGRLEAQKGFDLLINAFQTLVHRYPEWNLVILGEGNEQQQLMAQRDAAGLEQRVYMPGRVGNIAEWYECADVYVMSSRFEGFPNTLLEAMAHGLAAVSFDCETGPRDIIRDGVDGILVNPERGISGLSEALESIMTDRGRREAMGNAATYVREQFSMEKIGQLWDKALACDA
jgi:glycosyltransferase involved in cell wall biosynthesis